MRILKRLILISLIILVVLVFYITVNVDINSLFIVKNSIIISGDKNVESTTEFITRIKSVDQAISPELKYILQWTSAKDVPFMYMGKGRQGFIDRNCPYTNCYVTDDRKYFGGDITKFDVIAFSGPQVIRLNERLLPDKRSPHQKYVFASIESSDYYPVCSNRFDGFFNWTWTFKLDDSEVKWGYMVIRDKENEIVGPKPEMNWIKFEDMDSVSEELKQQLKSKSKAAAWFVSNCRSRSKREEFVKDLQKELKKYDLTVDVYGECGPLKCSRADEDACFNIIKEQYYFYLSFENSFSEDYVTEKLLNAVQNYAVPIVFGAANYTRFLPQHSYLNARELGIKDLAAKINQLIKNKDEYYEYFRWKKYYSYYRKKDSVETDPYCLFCKILNDREMLEEKKVYQNFREWWDPPNRC